MSNNEEKDPNTLEVFVSETVGVAELSPGGLSQGAPIVPPDEVIGKSEEELAKEREDALEAIRQRQVYLAEQYVPPHNKPGRRVKEEDLERLLKDARIMHEMCMVGRADYTTAFAIAHTQINSEDPLRFFVTMQGEIWINPIIVDKGHEINQVQEGCMSYPAEPMKPVIRFKKITVKYRTLGQKTNAETGEALAEPYLTNEITKELDGQLAQIVQHECQHLNGSDIYMDNGGGSKAFNEPVLTIIQP